jgi:maleate isomerase
MPDTLGWRMKFGILAPSPNTVVQPEYESMRPPGVSNNVYRMMTINPPQWKSNNDFSHAIQQVDAGIDAAVDQAMTSRPDHLILGVSIESVWNGGLGASERLAQRIESRAGSGIKVTQATYAIVEALKAFGVKKNIAVVTPYFPVAEQHLAGYFDEIGYRCLGYRHLQTTTPLGIAEINAERISRALRELDSNDIEAIVQFGANMPMVRFAAAAELWLGKPVIAVNAATYWHALRQNNISDKVFGCGRLLEEF